MTNRLFLALAAIALLPTTALAHPGGLNSDNCHAGTQPYHCHSPRQVPQPRPKPALTRGTIAISENYLGLGGACIQDGPSNVRVFPDIAERAIGTLATGSCGQALLSQNGFTLVRYQIEGLGYRRYWVHDSQITP